MHHPGEVNICTIAISVEGLLEQRNPENPMYNARVEWAGEDTA